MVDDAEVRVEHTSAFAQIPCTQVSATRGGNRACCWNLEGKVCVAHLTAYDVEGDEGDAPSMFSLVWSCPVCSGVLGGGNGPVGAEEANDAMVRHGGCSCGLEYFQ